MRRGAGRGGAIACREEEGLEAEEGFGGSGVALSFNASAAAAAAAEGPYMCFRMPFLLTLYSGSVWVLYFKITANLEC